MNILKKLYKSKEIIGMTDFVIGSQFYFHRNFCSSIYINERFLNILPCDYFPLLIMTYVKIYGHHQSLYSQKILLDFHYLQNSDKQ